MSDSLPQLPVWPHAELPFYAAELALQDRHGVRAVLDAGARRGVRGVLIEQHRAFFAQLPFILVGSVGADGQPWASILAGRAGFVHSPEPTHLRITGELLQGDPLLDNLSLGSPVGVLGIELPTRRRNRMNGRVAASDDCGFCIEVVQSYGNCPQYIQGRELRWVEDTDIPSRVQRSDRLSTQGRDLLEQADSFYVASNNPRDEDGVRSGADVSHRGGRPAFVHVDDDRTITTPDFVGNYFFNTIGNLTVEPRAGLLFVDFRTGDLLLAAAWSKVIWDGPDVEAFAGAQRLVRFHLTSVIRLERSLPLRALEVDYARELSQTGVWAEAAQALETKRAASWRRFRVLSRSAECDHVYTFVLVPQDGGGLAPHRAGQFLPLRLPDHSTGAHLVRAYTLSDIADGRHFRISVKRQGRASSWLHDHAQPGATVEALAPRSSFVVDESSRKPAVLISAGIGVTPHIAMLNRLLVNDKRTRHPRPIVFIHGARHSREHAFASQIRQKASRHGNLQLHVAYSAPLAGDRVGDTHDSVGRIDANLLKRFMPSRDCDAYICGPSSFMQSIYDALRELGVPDAQIHFEAFGSVRLQRSVSAVVADAPAHAAAVLFARHGVTLPWCSESGSLLDVALAAGVHVIHGCRTGVCGTCAVRLLEGEVDYAPLPVAECASDHVLLCCARPKAVAAAQVLKLDLQVRRRGVRRLADAARAFCGGRGVRPGAWTAPRPCWLLPTRPD
jgi:uncharacterized protein